MYGSGVRAGVRRSRLFGGVSRAGDVPIRAGGALIRAGGAERHRA
ncbi:hypothetical protein SAMN05421806_110129 [Streptomyces indicus]|uniref:Uncharacterized protein n=1 Tax=Streptomyces indicus TaxID=417292 RepID=A0A1G9DXK8_9ACTN|nr:hypothetical protein SAMN05421806_110129 [Streptomyces indicus]